MSDVLVWGTGGYGRLGFGDTRDQPVPRQLDHKDVLCVSAGLYHSAIVTTDHEVILLGSNATCCLSDPTSICTILNRVKIVQISVSGDLMGAHSLAVSNMGRLYSWGSAKSCGLGPGAEVITVPTLVTDFYKTADSTMAAPERVVFVSAGGSCSAVITAEGAVFTFGISVSGRLGYRASSSVQWRPRRVDALLGETVGSVSAGKNGHMLATTNRGQMYVWGENGRGQLGLGDLIDRYTPVKVAHPTHGVWSASVATGESHSLAVDADGKLWTWGCLSGCSELTMAMCVSFQLEGLQFEWARPRLVSALADFKVTRVAAGAAHSVAATSEGLLFVWGAKDQIGHKTNSSEQHDIFTCRLSGVFDPAAVAAGNYHTMVATGSSLVVDHLMRSLTRPISPASCDGHVSCVAGRLFIPSVLVKSLVGEAAWRSFWKPQVTLLYIRNEPNHEVVTSALSFSLSGEPAFKKSDDLLPDSLVAGILDEMVADAEEEEKQLEIPSECLFANLSLSAAELFFQILFSNSIPSSVPEELLRQVLPLAIVSQVRRPVALIQQRLKRLEGAEWQGTVPSKTVGNLGFNKKIGKEVIFACGPPIFREIDSEVSAHAFVVEANFPRLGLPVGDSLSDTSPARIAKGMTAVRIAPGSFSVNCLHIPVDVMAELVFFAYHSSFDNSQAELEAEFEYLEPESEQRGIRFWLTVAAVAERLGSVYGKAAAVDKLIENNPGKKWLMVHLTRLKMRPLNLGPCSQLDQTLLARAITDKVNLVVSHPEFQPKQPNYIHSKRELTELVDKLLGDCPEVEDESMGYKIRSGVIKRIFADLEVSSQLAKKLDHFNGLNLDPLKSAKKPESGWGKTWGSFSRNLRAMNISLRGGPSVGSTIRDLSLLGVVVAGFSMYVSNTGGMGLSILKTTHRNMTLISYIVLFFVILGVITKLLLKSKA